MSIVDWFLKDHVTLKTGVMGVKELKLYFTIYIQYYVLIYIAIIFHNIMQIKIQPWWGDLKKRKLNILLKIKYLKLLNDSVNIK